MKVKKKQKNSKNCVICGLDNAFGLKSFFYEMEDDSVCALFSFLPEHQSYPYRTHGGMITALLDEVMGRALWVKEPNVFACTTTINVSFRKAVPYGVPLKARGVITSNTKLFFATKGFIYGEDGTLLAQATANYMRLKNSVITGGKPADIDEEMCYNVKDDITEIDIPID